MLSRPLNGYLYRTPDLLRDLLLLDILELTGSTTAAARALSLSQPTVSRRYRTLARDLGLVRQPRQQPGRRYGDSICLRLLRKGMTLHRWQAGVLRIGGRPEHAQRVAGYSWLHWVGLQGKTLRAAPELIRQDLLDGLLLTQQEHAELQRFPAPSKQLGDGLVLVCRSHPRIQPLLAKMEEFQQPSLYRFTRG
ncbi:LysR family transcriptional regulator [Synechococcus sp. CCY9202]|uniref:helix-turn-helix domain-containing protein n=1 Tax=Synechococcus sp. CCY9202 TaxID=174698 RepID=UPI002B202B3E|nr:LysR family transcriptional regulator [Synechococcus sp. CCY9202]MEA5424052.1 LysR family transcriptional regulator [Synechococcus sp. CCY9202]